MDIQLLADKINLNTKLKNKVLSLVDKDRAKLIYLCNKAKSGDFKSLFTKNDLTKLAIALMYSAEITYPKYKKAKERYPIIHPKFSRDFAFHFAVGYPF